MYIFLLILIYIAFISLGLPDSLLGSGWPVMHTELGVYGDCIYGYLRRNNYLKSSF